MSLYYTHTLITIPKDFIPSAMQVSEFLRRLTEMGVVPKPISLSGMAPTGKTRTIPNSFGAGPLVHEIRGPIKIETIDDIAGAVAGLSEYGVGIEGTGRPELQPLPMDFSDDYTVTVRCQVSSILRSTSDPHDDFGDAPKAVPYGERCPEGQSSGLFVNPHTVAEIEIRDAGCARFWIEFELGKNLFPLIENDNLQLLNPAIVTEASRVFKQQFVQGCYWG